MPYSCWRWEAIETVDSSIRASAFAGLGALALSIIIAAFSRVPLGILLLRALLSGLVFAGLVFAGLRILRQFLPELWGEAPGGLSPAAETALGSRVDIVLPGADEVSAETPGASPDSTASRAAPPGEGPLAGAMDTGALQREVASLRSEVLVPGDSGEPGAQGAAPRPSVALDELDTLPDLDGFSDAFSAQGETPGAAGSDFGDAGLGASGEVGAGSDASRYMGPSSSMPTAGAPDAGTDPAVLAKAVQTLLRRDQKGQ